MISLAKETVIRFKWFFLGGCGLIVFSSIIILSSALFLSEANTPSEEVEPSPDPETPTNPMSDVFVISPTSQDIATVTPVPTESEKVNSSREIAYVEHVVDGDSIEVRLDGTLIGLRYIGIDAPEIGMPYSVEAAEFNRELVEGQIVELERDISETDKYGRLLRYVYLQDGTMVNAELVRLGFALALDYPPDTKYQALFNSAEEEAKQIGIGLWTPPTPTTPVDQQDLTPKIRVEPNCSQFNSPGNDNENKNEEYVCFVNLGTGAVDLSGWLVKDQYGWTYVFPAFSLNKGSQVKVRTGCGIDTEQDLFWCKDETAVWNNDGDCVYLMTPDDQLFAEYCY